MTLLDVKAVWDRHEVEAYRRDISHWRGHGRWSDEAWNAIGEGTVKALRKIGVDLNDGDSHVMLEWGPGGGANVAALSRWATCYVGVDVSAKNLARAATETKGWFVPVLLAGEPRVECPLPPSVFLSTACFQHFPSDDYAEAVLRGIARVTAPGALGIIQIREDDGSGVYGLMQRGGDYERDHIYAWAATVDGFKDMCKRAGFEVVGVFDRIPRVAYVTVGLRKT